MSILFSMLAYLKTCTAITDLVGTKIYPVRYPQGALENKPFITYQLIDEPTVNTHDGKSVYKARVQVDAWGETYLSAHAVGDALHAALHGYRGSWSPYTIGNVLRKRKQDIPEPDIEASRVSQDFVISYSEE